MSVFGHIPLEPLVFNERWTVQGTIGKGAFSEIYAAQDKKKPSEGLVAIKLQNADFDSSVMKWESMVMLDLSSISTIPKFNYYGHEHGRDYMVMELLTGEDMSSLRDRCRLSIPSRLFPVEVASLLTRQMVKCLQAMHEKGYVHRDVKPSNFVRRSKCCTDFCIIDFGLAKQHRDAQGNLRAEREKVEFRGTTIYASPYVHCGRDQCPRDDVYCTLHAFLDLVLGDLPWRMHARNRDKAAVAALKASLLDDPADFLHNYLKLQESGGILSEASLKALRAAVSSIESVVCEFVAHMKSLSYSDIPNYALINELLLRPVDPALTDDIVGNVEYTANGFTWNSATTIEDTMARYQLQQSAQAAATAGPSNGNSKTRRSTDRLSMEHLPDAAADGAVGRKSMGTGEEDAGQQGGAAPVAVSNKPFMQVRTQASSGEYKLQNLQDKLSALLRETELFRAAQSAAASAKSPTASASKAVAAVAAKASSSASTSVSGHSNGNNGGSDGVQVAAQVTAQLGALQQQQQVAPPERPLLGLDVAVRWRNLTRELLKLPDSLVSASIAVDLGLQVLVSNDHFFACDLGGEYDKNWAEFSDVQSTVAAFYEFYAAAKRSRAKSMESLLAKVGGETAPAPGPAASCSSSNGNSNRAAPDEFPEDNSVGQVMKHRGRRIQDSDDLGSEESLQLPVPPPSSASSLHLQEPVVPGCQATATSSLEVPEPMAVTEEADPAHSNNNSISSGGAHKEEEEEGVVEPAAKRPRT